MKARQLVIKSKPGLKNKTRNNAFDRDCMQNRMVNGKWQMKAHYLGFLMSYRTCSTLDIKQTQTLFL